MNTHTPFEQLPALEQAWQLGYKEATSAKANIEANPYPVDSEESEQWLKGYDNCMDLLYGSDRDIDAFCSTYYEID